MHAELMIAPAATFIPQSLLSLNVVPSRLGSLSPPVEIPKGDSHRWFRGHSTRVSVKHLGAKQGIAGNACSVWSRASGIVRYRSNLREV